MYINIARKCLDQTTQNRNLNQGFCFYAVDRGVRSRVVHRSSKLLLQSAVDRWGIFFCFCPVVLRWLAKYLGFMGLLYTEIDIHELTSDMSLRFIYRNMRVNGIYVIFDTICILQSSCWTISYQVLVLDYKLLKSSCWTISYQSPRVGL